MTERGGSTFRGRYGLETTSNRWLLRIRDLYDRPVPTISFEYFPPKSAEAEEKLLRETTPGLKALGPAFISVTYGAGGSTRDNTLRIVNSIRRDYGIDAMPHLTCVGHTQADLLGIMHEAEASGIENVLALRGDPPQGQEEWTKTEGGLEFSHQLVELISGDYPLTVGAACFPETHIHAESAESDMRYLAEKVAAGVDFLITQMFFDNSFYFDFVRRARAAGIGVPIIPGIMPVTNFSQIKRITDMCGATIPAEFERELAARADDPNALTELGVAYATLQCAELLSRGAPGIHFYTLNQSALSLEICRRIAG